MKTLFGLAVIPLFCMGIMMLTALVIIIALRRGTKTINEQADQVIAEKQKTPTINTRWARSDLQGESKGSTAVSPLVSCPACGGKSPAGNSTCAFCGRKLKISG